MFTPAQFFDSTHSNAINTTGTVSTLNFIGTGTSVFNRNGNVIKPKLLEIRGVFTIQSNTTTSDAARILVVWDKQPNALTPGVSSFLLDQNQGGTSTSALSGHNTDNAYRYVVLDDTLLALPANPAGSVAGTGHQLVPFHRLIPLSGEMVYGDTAASLPRSGTLWLVSTGLNAAGSDAFVLNTSSRLTFVE